jgi:CPA2 family monovalent cation:H+ antiporter-2
MATLDALGYSPLVAASLPEGALATARDIALILLCSLPVLFLFRKIGVSSVVGYLVVGVAIGPFGFGLVSEKSGIEALAEIGVMLLLFVVGLEFSIDKLTRMKRMLTIGGSSQMLAVFAAVAGVLWAIGLPLREAAFFGLAVAFSSTAIVLTILEERGETGAPHGKASVGILLAQDLAVAPALALVPALAARGAESLQAAGEKMLTALVFVVVALVVARKVLPKLLYFVAKIGAREAFTVGVALVALGAAYLAEIAGLTFSVGAFVAGMLISESEFSHQTAAEILPFKDVFNALFFVSIGMLLNGAYLMDNPVAVALAVVGVLVIKFVVVFAVVRALGHPTRTALLSGLALAQIGEFSFLIVRYGAEFDLASAGAFNVFLASSMFTMLATPFMIMWGPRLADKLGGKLPRKTEPKGAKMKGHAIVVGYGVVGRSLAAALKEDDVAHVVVEANPTTARKCLREGEPMIFGDASKREIMEAAGVEGAALVAISIPDPTAARRALSIAKRLNPDCVAVVRARYVGEIEELRRLGADEVVPDELEASLRFFSVVLRRFGAPESAVVTQITQMRNNYYLSLREPGELRLDGLRAALAKRVVDTVEIADGNPNLGKTLGEIHLRARSGASAVAVVRGEETTLHPDGNERVRVGDSFVLAGERLAVERAAALLTGAAVPVDLAAAPTDATPSDNERERNDDAND